MIDSPKFTPGCPISDSSESKPDQLPSVPEPEGFFPAQQSSAPQELYSTRELYSTQSPPDNVAYSGSPQSSDDRNDSKDLKPALVFPDRRRLATGVITGLLLLAILLVGLYFRLTGSYWGEFQYLHPDERFLVWVGSDITPIKSISSVEGENLQKEWISLSDYFDTANSSMNPHNRGHGFYVYGTLPMFITRLVVEWVYGHSGFEEMTRVGRPLSALADILVVLLVYLTAVRLYNKRVGLLAAAFSAGAVMQIQQSHFFTMDTFINLFTFLALYFAVRIAGDVLDHNNKKKIAAEHSESAEIPDDELDSAAAIRKAIRHFVSQPMFWLSLGFGAALGMAVASKLNAAPMAVALPIAILIRLVSLSPQKRQEELGRSIGYLALAAFVSIVVFRICQPYAFSGPGFFGLKLNPLWVENIRSLSSQVSGDTDYPPSLQWARRAFTFGWENMVKWGLGLPLGIPAWLGFLAAGWQILKGKWKQHALLWGWTVIYFVWQSMAFNPTMRYFLPIYPTLAIFAAWVVVAWSDHQKIAVQHTATATATASSTTRTPRLGTRQKGFRWNSILAAVVGIGVLLATWAWAFAFSNIYTRPVTRIDASRWIYENIPGPINLHIESKNEAGPSNDNRSANTLAATGPADTLIHNQMLSFPYDQAIDPALPYSISFNAAHTGLLREIYLPHVADRLASSETYYLNLSVSLLPNGEAPIDSSLLMIDNSSGSPDRIATLMHAIDLVKGQPYYLTIVDPMNYREIDACGQKTSLYIDMNTDLIEQPLIQIDECRIKPGLVYSAMFVSSQSGRLMDIYFSQYLDAQINPAEKTLAFQVTTPAFSNDSIASQVIYSGTITSAFPPGKDIVGSDYTVTFDPPVPMIKDQNYQLSIQLQSNSGLIALRGASIANEGEWDDGLPLRMAGYDPFGGLYPTELNFNMYWDDNPEKLERFIRIMNAAEYIVITSSRQWATLPRLPERFPMTSVYYRHLLGCPDEKSIEWCYSVAQPGTFAGKLGYDLIKTFQSDPAINSLSINDQFAEEAFTVYDHPKVLIFKKTDSFSFELARSYLGSVDFTQVVRLTPKRSDSYPGNLMLPEDRLAEQQQGGTWSELFNSQSLLNRFQFLGVIIWYLSISLLGWLAYPLLRLALPGFSDGGYPMARLAGLLLLTYLVWMAGSFRIPFSRLTISVALLLLTLACGYLAFRQRAALRAEWQQHKNYFLIIEGLFLAFFLLFLLVRLGNPDLWHPWKGGEKPMDFAYFNAVLRSTTFPPYDPWYQGGYLNYYYYGYVMASVLVKWLGIVPAIAYNLVLPTFFSFTAMGAFSLAWNLSQRNRPPIRLGTALIPAISAAIVMVILGNMGSLRMIFRGYQMLVDPTLGKDIYGQPAPSLVTRWMATYQGIGEVLAGKSLPYSVGDWYWNPTRIMTEGDNAITEFPAFTFLYADLHAHLFALPIALLGLGWSLSLILGRARWKNKTALLLSFLIGAIAIGALRTTNTWDFYTYLLIAGIAIVYSFVRYLPLKEMTFGGWQTPLLRLPDFSNRLLAIIAAGASLIILSIALYQPFSNWYGQGYSTVEFWKYQLTPLNSYFTHWGLFLFVLATWMLWETREWMAHTPLSSLRRLEPYWEVIWLFLGLLVILILALAIKLPSDAQALVGEGFFKNLPIGRGIEVAPIVLPLAAWAGILLLRPGLPDSKRIVLFLTGTGLVITLFVEVVVLRGDIGRQNTVFKFYLQVWTMYSVCAAAALGWLLKSMRDWLAGWRTTWQAIFIFLVFAASLFPLLGGAAKIKDRMSDLAPHTLDGMAYMQYGEYFENNHRLDLNEDYLAIRWMQENIHGSPVIVEANSRNLYRWYLRFTNNTGLPNVVGWEWHQQQQRAINPAEWVNKRVIEVDEFYNTISTELALDFLEKYNVRYIVVGQLERATYGAAGLEKFETYNGYSTSAGCSTSAGSLWCEVYRNGETVIYEVLAATQTVPLDSAR